MPIMLWSILDELVFEDWMPLGIERRLTYLPGFKTTAAWPVHIMISTNIVWVIVLAFLSASP